MRFSGLYAEIVNIIMQYHTIRKDQSVFDLITAILELSPDFTYSDVVCAAEFLYYRLRTYENVMAALNDGLSYELYGELEHVIGSQPAEED